MNKNTEDDFQELDLDEPSLLGRFLVIGGALLILVLVLAVGYFIVFGKNKPVQGEGTDRDPIVTETPAPTNTPAPTATPKPQAENTEENENPTGMGQEPEVFLPESEEPNVEGGLVFREVEEIITAKDATNLRNMPSQGKESKIMVTLKNGQKATRIGISDSGWSKVEYKGEVYYAVSNYLTTDLTPATPVPVDDGIKTVFTACDDKVSPKIEVNLRALPSVTNPEAVVVVKLPYGAVVKRTGINTDVGWSRVEYEGQTLYCVSSYVYVVEE